MATELEKLWIALLIGQSNMSGRGIVEPQDIAEIPGAYKLNSGGCWVPATDPLNSDQTKPIGVGPGREFARTVLNAVPAIEVGLVAAAVGGTTLNQWKPGGRFYARAMRMLGHAKKSGSLRVILWHLGETDASGTVEAAHSYAERWVKIMQRLRQDSGADDIPIIVGKLGGFIDRDHIRVINEQIDLLPKLIDHVSVVSVAGLKDGGDRLHFDASSQRALGRRYAHAFLQFAR